MNLSVIPSLCVLLLASTLVMAQETDVDYLEMSLEELLEVQVVSGARSEQSFAELSVPVSVLTGEEIRRSGLTCLPEVLALMPGVDVYRIDRTHYIVSVRGMTSQFSDRTLVLINGRDASNPVFGAPDWLSLPVLIQDIERIEVLRGPGGGVWGANAYTGVINIITNNPGPNGESSINTTVNHFGDTYSQLKVANSNEDFSWRVSAGYEDFENSDEAGAGQQESAFPSLNGVMGFSTYQARDMARVWRFDSELVKPLNATSSLNAGAAHTEGERGDREWVGFYPGKDGRVSMTRVFTKLDHTFNERTQGYVQWFGNYSVTHAPEMMYRYGYYQNDLEGQLCHQLSETHQVTLGGNLRAVRLTGKNSDDANEAYFTQEAYDEYWVGAYLVDRLTLAPRWTLESQGRLDRYSYNGWDWSGRVALLHALDEAKNHVLRLSAARSFRAAIVMNRSLLMNAMGGLYVYLESSDERDNETTYALEGGYVGRLSRHLQVRIDGYYQRMEHLLGVIVQEGMPTYLQIANLQGADAYGGECEVSWATESTRLSTWYAYHELVTTSSDMSIRACLPSRHRVGLRYGHQLLDHWSLQSNYVYQSGIKMRASQEPLAEASATHRWDVTLSRSWRDDHIEVMMGVADILNKTQEPVFDLSDFSSYETPGRTFFARVGYRF